MMISSDHTVLLTEIVRFVEQSSVDLFWDGMVRGEVRTGSRMAYEYGSSPADAVVLHFQVCLLAVLRFWSVKA